MQIFWNIQGRLLRIRKEYSSQNLYKILLHNGHSKLPLIQNLQDHPDFFPKSMDFSKMNTIFLLPSKYHLWTSLSMQISQFQLIFYFYSWQDQSAASNNLKIWKHFSLLTFNKHWSYHCMYLFLSLSYNIGRHCLCFSPWIHINLLFAILRFRRALLLFWKAFDISSNHESHFIVFFKQS